MKFGTAVLACVNALLANQCSGFIRSTPGGGASSYLYLSQNNPISNGYRRLATVDDVAEKQELESPKDDIDDPIKVAMTATRWIDEPLNQSVILDEKRDGPLLKDIELLNDVLAEIVKRENPEVHDIFTRFRQHGLNRAGDIDDPEPLRLMVQCAKDLTSESALGVMRCFSVALNLINSAEVHHRNRLLKQYELAADTLSSVGGPLPMTEDSMRGTIQILIDEGRTKDEIFEAMTAQKVEIVLTAHPMSGNLQLHHTY